HWDPGESAHRFQEWRSLCSTQSTRRSLAGAGYRWRFGYLHLNRRGTDAAVCASAELTVIQTQEAMPPPRAETAARIEF
ncbi:MAG TPA: hypothetical protein V6D06_11575, partial [Trichocoleus sp.]